MEELALGEYTLEHVRAFGMYNHLHLDPWYQDSVLFVDSRGRVLSFTAVQVSCQPSRPHVADQSKEARKGACFSRLLRCCPLGNPLAPETVPCSGSLALGTDPLHQQVETEHHQGTVNPPASSGRTAQPRRMNVEDASVRTSSQKRAQTVELIPRKSNDWVLVW